jgi:uncharacterized glyoxalase superfamily metalloenzyme YdcJ
MFKEVKIDIRKLRDYCLNSKHPVGKHKARVFASYLGLDRNDADLLKQKIANAIKKAEIQTEGEDKFGRRYSADIELDIKNNTAVVKTIWIIRSGEQIPELVTCYVIT